MIEKDVVILNLNDYDRFRKIEQKHYELKNSLVVIRIDENQFIFGQSDIDHYELDIEIIKNYLNIPQDIKLIIK